MIFIYFMNFECFEYELKTTKQTLLHHGLLADRVDYFKWHNLSLKEFIWIRILEQIDK